MATKSSGGGADRIKLAAAIGALAVAGVLIAWQLGALDSLFKSAPADPNASMTAEEKAEVQKRMKEAEEQAKITPPS